MVLVCWLIDWRRKYRYHGSLLLGSHCVTGAMGGSETTVTSRMRNTGLTQLPHVVFVFLKVSWLVSVYGWLRNPLNCPTKKWDTCRTEETLTLSFFLSIMATTIGNSNNGSGSSHLYQCFKEQC